MYSWNQIGTRDQGILFFKNIISLNPVQIDKEITRKGLKIYFIKSGILLCIISLCFPFKAPVYIHFDSEKQHYDALVPLEPLEHVVSAEAVSAQPAALIDPSSEPVESSMDEDAEGPTDVNNATTDFDSMDSS